MSSSKRHSRLAVIAALFSLVGMEVFCFGMDSENTIIRIASYACLTASILAWAFVEPKISALRDEELTSTHSKKTRHAQYAPQLALVHAKKRLLRTMQEESI